MSARRNRLGLMYLQLKGTLCKIFFPQRAQTFSMDTWHVLWSLHSNGHSKIVQPYIQCWEVFMCYAYSVSVLLCYRKWKPLCHVSWLHYPQVYSFHGNAGLLAHLLLANILTLSTLIGIVITHHLYLRKPISGMKDSDILRRAVYL